MCGVIGIYKPSDPVNTELFDGLIYLQHRGQDAAGISTLDESGALHLFKGAGLVRDVVRTRHMYRLKGRVGIGHVRYPTAGTDSQESAQPFYVNSPFGITLAHNGNLVNTESLIGELQNRDFRHLNTQSDSEVLLNVLAHELQNQARGEKPESLFKAVEQVQNRCEGAYAVVALISGVGLLAFRDPGGIRPLVYGKREEDTGTSYIVASESVALDQLGYEFLGDIAPGGVLFIDLKGGLHSHQGIRAKAHTPCLFEFVYMARSDSVMDGISVHKTRLELGRKLGEMISEQWGDLSIDVVIPVPETSRTAALGVAQQLGLKYQEGFVKNRYIGRTFIMPGQKGRKKSVRQKLNTIDLEFEGKNVLLVDDSIVRGTTSQEIIQMARDAGASQVYFASAAPMVRYPNVYGIDMPAADELVAHKGQLEEVRDLIRADALIFQSLENLYQACQQGNPQITAFEDSVFTGRYVCGQIDEAYLGRLYRDRSKR